MKIKRLFFLAIFSLYLFFSCNSNSPTQKEHFAKYDVEKLRSKAAVAKTFCKSKDYNTDYCFLADMSLHSGVNRLFIWNFNKDTITHSFLVGHGCGNNFWSFDFTKQNPSFSNEKDSHCSSLGKYKIGNRGYSNWGIHINYVLHGLDKTNSNALARQIVLHSWDKMSDTETFPEGSPEGWGCPTLGNKSMQIIDKKLQQSKKPVLLWLFE